MVWKTAIVVALFLLLPANTLAIGDQASNMMFAPNNLQSVIENHPPDITIGSDEQAIINWTINQEDTGFFQVVRNGHSIIIGIPENGSVIVNITDYAAGQYNFTLFASDHRGSVHNDTVTVIVVFVGSEAYLSQLTVPFVGLNVFPITSFGNALVSVVLIGLLLRLRSHHLEELKEQLPKTAVVIGHNKALAAIIILIVLFGFYPFGKWVVLSPNPYIKVAVIDSGIDPIPELHGRIAAEKSFVTPEFGYDFTDLTTTDCRPHGRQHGTNVAMLVAESKHAAIVNCKVGTADKGATTMGFVAAVLWAVGEQNCTVINYSYGGSILANDAHQKVVEWAFKRGVLFVSSVGNEGWEIYGNSVSTPGVLPYCLTVGSVDEYNYRESYSSKGVTRDYSVKPEIYACGSIDKILTQLRGTSYASPRVAAAAVELIHHCNTIGASYTPGMIMAALAETSTPPRISRTYQDIVGGGVMDLSAAMTLVESSSRESNVPSITSVLPKSLPIVLDRLFLGDRYRFSISVFCSGIKNFTLSPQGLDAAIINVNPWVVVNQTAQVPITITVPSYASDSLFEATLVFETMGEVEAAVDIQFQAVTPTARIAFDISHSLNATNSKYGRYLKLYTLLTDRGISVTEINYLSDFTLTELQRYDAILMLSPYSIAMDEESILMEYSALVPYNDSERMKLQQYFESGGRVFIAGNFFSTDNDRRGDRHMVATALNQLLNWTPIGFKNFTWGRTVEPIYVDGISAHSITQSIDGIQWAGAGLQLSSGASPLVWFYQEPGNPSTVEYLMAAMDDSVTGGRLVVSGSEIFLCNEYLASVDDHVSLVFNIIDWLTVGT